MKTIIFLCLGLFASPVWAAEVFNCAYSNNLKFDLSVSEIKISKYMDSYYNSGDAGISFYAPENQLAMRADRVFNCEQVEIDADLVCKFKNGRFSAFKVKSVKIGNGSNSYFDQDGRVFEEVEEYLLVDGQSVFDLLARYENVDCSLKF